MQSQPYRRRRKRLPIQAAVEDWIASLGKASRDEALAWHDVLVGTAPKRFTIYEPMALLPASSFATEAWVMEMRRHDANTLSGLWWRILTELSQGAKKPLTHLAANEGIPPQDAGGRTANVRRSSSELRVFFGDFGPARLLAEKPADADFDGALQRKFRHGPATVRSTATEEHECETEGEKADWAVDLYAGIGYFVFCYVSLGMRVLCWEINPWSVEGLRRGARVNRWTVKVVQGTISAFQWNN